MSIHVEDERRGSKIYRKYFCPVDKCDVFKYSFKDLKEHVAYNHEDHTDEFKCSKCSKSFSTVRRLVRHKCPYATPHAQEYYEKETIQTTLLDTK